MPARSGGRLASTDVGSTGTLVAVGFAPAGAGVRLVVATAVGFGGLVSGPTVSRGVEWGMAVVVGSICAGDAGAADWQALEPTNAIRASTDKLRPAAPIPDGVVVHRRVAGKNVRATRCRSCRSPRCWSAARPRDRPNASVAARAAAQIHACADAPRRPRSPSA